ncbi:MAG: hypothetical protein HYY25_07425 [Candidatus Wallbacteria bacterium]|nr:hypothetical protein [Candidatus Wallbacteria bacterium]
MRPRNLLALLVALPFAAAAALAQDVGQLNWRVTDAERRLALIENSIANLQGQVQTLETRLQSLDARFSQLVNLLDHQRKEDHSARLRMEASLEKIQAELSKSAPKAPDNAEPSAPPAK